jgi:diketogulonate reductase-like aldo/keto reductase
MSFLTYNGVAVPSYMYGTAWKKQETTRLVKLAVEKGFTAIDTANQIIHYDEALVGKALQEIWSSGVKRQDLFLQTKFTSVNGQDHRTPYDAKADLGTQVRQSVESSLKHLHTDYIDSYVLHGPYYRNRLVGEDWEIWGAIEDEFKAGKFRMVGVSNVSAEQLRELCSKAKVKPMIVQNRCFAVTAWDKEVRGICQEHNIIYQGFSLLTANQAAFGDAAVHRICKRLGSTVAQMVFAFSLQIGIQVLTGTTTAKHMEEDLQSHSFVLEPDELKQIESIALRV